MRYSTNSARVFCEEYDSIKRQFDRLAKSIIKTQEDVNCPVKYRITEVDKETNQFELLVLGQRISMQLNFEVDENDWSKGNLEFYLPSKKNALIRRFQIDVGGLIRDYHIEHSKNYIGECSYEMITYTILSTVVVALTDVLSTK